MAEKLFAEFPPVSTEKWEEVINKDLKGADYEKKLVWRTQEGFNVRPYYRAEDLQKIDHLASQPGEYPYVRGTKNNNRWLIRQDYCACDGHFAEANKEAVDGLNRGAEAVGFCIDGKKAVSESDFAALLEGIDLNKVEVNFTQCCCACPETIKNFIAYAKSKNIDSETLRASFDYDPLRALTLQGNFCSEKSLELLKDCVEAAADYPHVRVIGVDANLFNDCGSTITQELAFGLAMGSEYLNILTDQGIAAEQAAKKIKFTFAVSSNYFMEISKFRAARMLWANIIKAYGVENTCAQKIKIHAVTSRWNQSVYDAYVNMLRNTTEAMSAAIAGVDSLTVTPFDHAYHHYGEFSNRMSRNVQSILKEEAHFDKVVDPAAGSYYVETLTASIAQVAWDLFKEIENEGGYIEAFKKGHVQKLVKEASAKKDKNFATRKETILGVNQFPNFNEVADKDITKEIVTRPTLESLQLKDTIAEPLVPYRGGQAFEALRFATDRSGKTPKAFMLTFGNLAMCRARAQFSSNFFAVAGIKPMDNNRFSTIEEGVKAALESKAEIVVACSADDEYLEAVPQIAQMIGDKAIVVVAGDPECRAELEEKGIRNFINVRSNVLETLKSYQTALGIK